VLLAPVKVNEMLRVIENVCRALRFSILLVAQNVARSLALARRGYAVENAASC